LLDKPCFRVRVQPTADHLNVVVNGLQIQMQDGLMVSDAVAKATNALKRVSRDDLDEFSS